jgi:hypothetical protein
VIIRSIGGIGALIAGSMLFTPPVEAQRPFDGLSCENPDLNFEIGEYPSALTLHTGNATEPVSGRPFFLDFPCDLDPGDHVTFVLNLHGGGSLANWQRHYFPIFHYKDEYDLVIATPDAGDPGGGTWDPEVDDEYLQGVVTYVHDLFSDYDITFWFAGHSFGGATTRRLICTDFYQSYRPVGFVSLSGGRVGSPRAGRGGGPPAPLPECDFSHIFTVGEHERSGGELDEVSRWADKYHCGARVLQQDVIDTRPGYAYDSRRQDPGTQSWGLLPRPGVTEWQLYPGCDGGRVVADLIRIDKGHTEGLEENVVEQIVQLMMAAGPGATQ